MNIILNQKNSDNGKNQQDKSSLQKKAYSFMNSKKEDGKGNNKKKFNYSRSFANMSASGSTKNKVTTPLWDSKIAKNPDVTSSEYA